jgi:hypothetical protein
VIIAIDAGVCQVERVLVSKINLLVGQIVLGFQIPDDEILFTLSIRPTFKRVSDLCDKTVVPEESR